MPEEVTRLRIFVASPGDVLDERERLKLVVDELDRTLADSLGRSLELLDWRDVVPSMGRPEQVILDQLKLDAWDIFVGILWTRFGTPTGATHPDTDEPFLSGTEEEFALAYHSWQRTGRPQILSYRCMRPPQLDKLDASQFQRVQQFFAQFKAEGEHPGLYQHYRTPEEFERRVRSDLTQLILSYTEPTREPKGREEMEMGDIGSNYKSPKRQLEMMRNTSASTEQTAGLGKGQSKEMTSPDQFNTLLDFIQLSMTAPEFEEMVARLLTPRERAGLPIPLTRVGFLDSMRIYERLDDVEHYLRGNFTDRFKG